MLALIAWLIVIETFAIVGAIIWLGFRVSKQFRHHDRDLRSVVELANKNFACLLERVPRA